MGRLEIEIRHGNDSGPGWVVALIVIIVLAVAGGTHGKAVSAFAHDVLVGVEISAAVLGSALVIALAVVATRITARIRRAHRATAARNAATVITVTPSRAPSANGAPRAALGAPYQYPAGWPVTGQPDAVPADADDRRRS